MPLVGYDGRPGFKVEAGVRHGAADDPQAIWIYDGTSVWVAPSLQQMVPTRIGILDMTEFVLNLSIGK